MSDVVADTALVIMARYPELGKTKTRLARSLGDADTLNIYRAFLGDIAHHHAIWQAYTPCWSYTPDGVNFQEIIDELAPRHAVPMRYFSQQGNDFSQRLLYAFQWAQSQGFTRTILIGTDSPQLSHECVMSARKALDDVDVVVGPSLDGGYYLLGMHSAHDVFSGIPMSTDVVTKMTLAAVKSQGLTVQLLDALFDVDELSDLVRLAHELEQDPTLAPVTAAHLKTMRSFHDHSTSNPTSPSNDTAALDLHRADQPLQ